MDVGGGGAAAVDDGVLDVAAAALDGAELHDGGGSDEGRSDDGLDGDGAGAAQPEAFAASGAPHAPSAAGPDRATAGRATVGRSEDQCVDVLAVAAAALEDDDSPAAPRDGDALVPPTPLVPPVLSPPRGGSYAGFGLPASSTRAAEAPVRRAAEGDGASEVKGVPVAAIATTSGAGGRGSGDTDVGERGRGLSSGRPSVDGDAGAAHGDGDATGRAAGAHDNYEAYIRRAVLEGNTGVLDSKRLFVSSRGFLTTPTASSSRRHAQGLSASATRLARRVSDGMHRAMADARLRPQCCANSRSGKGQRALIAADVMLGLVLPLLAWTIYDAIGILSIEVDSHLPLQRSAMAAPMCAVMVLGVKRALQIWPNPHRHMRTGNRARQTRPGVGHGAHTARSGAAAAQASVLEIAVVAVLVAGYAVAAVYDTRPADVSGAGGTSAGAVPPRTGNCSVLSLSPDEFGVSQSVTDDATRLAPDLAVCRNDDGTSGMPHIGMMDPRTGFEAGDFESVDLMVRSVRGTSGSLDKLASGLATEEQNAACVEQGLKAVVCSGSVRRCDAHCQPLPLCVSECSFLLDACGHFAPLIELLLTEGSAATTIVADALPEPKEYFLWLVQLVPMCAADDPIAAAPPGTFAEPPLCSGADGNVAADATVGEEGQCHPAGFVKRHAQYLASLDAGDDGAFDAWLLRQHLYRCLFVVCLWLAPWAFVWRFYADGLKPLTAHSAWVPSAGSVQGGGGASSSSTRAGGIGVSVNSDGRPHRPFFGSSVRVAPTYVEIMSDDGSSASGGAGAGGAASTSSPMAAHESATMAAANVAVKAVAEGSIAAHVSVSEFIGPDTALVPSAETHVRRSRGGDTSRREDEIMELPDQRTIARGRGAAVLAGPASPSAKAAGTAPGPVSASSAAAARSRRGLQGGANNAMAPTFVHVVRLDTVIIVLLLLANVGVAARLAAFSEASARMAPATWFALVAVMCLWAASSQIFAWDERYAELVHRYRYGQRTYHVANVDESRTFFSRLRFLAVAAVARFELFAGMESEASYFEMRVQLSELVEVTTQLLSLFDSIRTSSNAAFLTMLVAVSFNLVGTGIVRVLPMSRRGRREASVVLDLCCDLFYVGFNAFVALRISGAEFFGFLQILAQTLPIVLASVTLVELNSFVLARRAEADCAACHVPPAFVSHTTVHANKVKLAVTAEAKVERHRSMRAKKRRRSLSRGISRARSDASASATAASQIAHEDSTVSMGTTPLDRESSTRSLKGAMERASSFVAIRGWRSNVTTVTSVDGGAAEAKDAAHEEQLAKEVARYEKLKTFLSAGTLGEADRVRKRNRVIAMATRAVSCLLITAGVSLAVVTTVRVAQTEAECLEIAGPLWHGVPSDNKRFFSNGFLGPAECGFEAQEHLDLTPDHVDDSVVEIDSRVALFPNLRVIDATGNTHVQRSDVAVASSLPRLSQLLLHGTPAGRVIAWRGGNLTQLPSVLWAQGECEELDLSNNALVSLPPEFTGDVAVAEGEQSAVEAAQGEAPMPLLRVLNLTGNALTELPEKLPRYGRLERLYVRGNRLASVPAVYTGKGMWAQLTHLDIGDNRFTHLDGAMVRDVGNLNAAPNDGVTGLRYGGTRIAVLSSLPETVFDLPLAHIDLYINHVNVIPDSISKVGATLVYLNMDWGGLTYDGIPSREVMEQLTVLEFSWWNNNAIGAGIGNGRVPEALFATPSVVDFGISCNQITSVPQSVFAPLKLRGVTLRSNLGLASLPMPPASCTEPGVNCADLKVLDLRQTGFTDVPEFVLKPPYNNTLDGLNLEWTPIMGGHTFSGLWADGDPATVAFVADVQKRIQNNTNMVCGGVTGPVYPTIEHWYESPLTCWRPGAQGLVEYGHHTGGMELCVTAVFD